MSDGTASLRRKIHSAEDLQSVVRTMKALAASSIGQYEQSVRALAEYNRAVELGLSACFRALEPGRASVGTSRRARAGAIGVVVFGSDQGLVGQFNDVVVDHAFALLAERPGEPRLWSVGERVRARLADAGRPVAGVFPVPSSVDAIAPLVGRILIETERHDRVSDVAELHLVYNSPTSGAVYAPVTQRLLPLDDEWRRALAGVPWPTKQLPEVLGHGAATLSGLIREYVFVSLFRACAESLASENASRLAAMERAERNIDELLAGFRAAFHTLRQSSIDAELFDVIAGFEAIGGTRS